MAVNGGGGGRVLDEGGGTKFLCEESITEADGYSGSESCRGRDRVAVVVAGAGAGAVAVAVGESRMVVEGIDWWTTEYSWEGPPLIPFCAGGG